MKLTDRLRCELVVLLDRLRYRLEIFVDRLDPDADVWNQFIMHKHRRK